MTQFGWLVSSLRFILCIIQISIKHNYHKISWWTCRILVTTWLFLQHHHQDDFFLALKLRRLKKMKESSLCFSFCWTVSTASFTPEDDLNIFSTSAPVFFVSLFQRNTQSSLSCSSFIFSLSSTLLPEASHRKQVETWHFRSAKSKRRLHFTCRMVSCLFYDHVLYRPAKPPAARCTSSVFQACLLIDPNANLDIGRIQFQRVDPSEWSPEAREERGVSLSRFLFSCTLTVKIRDISVEGVVHVVILSPPVHCKTWNLHLN